MQAGVVGAPTCTDISPGMLDDARGQRARLGLDVETVACDAAALPFEDAIVRPRARPRGAAPPARARASFAEFRRVLRPGGDAVVRGRAVAPGRPHRRDARSAPALRAAPLWRRAVRARPGRRRRNGAPRAADDDHALESVVDVHAFDPGDLERHARGAGFADVRVRGEELLANWFGWFNRTLEASASHDDIPWPWFQYAYRGYLAAAEASTARCSSRACRRRSSTT